MIKNHHDKFNKIHVLMNACIIVISYLLAYYLRFYVLNNGLDFFKIGIIEKWYPLDAYTGKLVLIVPLYLFLYYFFNLYTPIEQKLTLTKVCQIILVNILGIVLFLLALYIQKENDISRQFLVLFLAINVMLSVVPRMLYSYFLKIRRKNNK